MKIVTMLVSGLVGLLLVVCAVVYAVNPATSLPHFFPGYVHGLMKHHYTHAAVCLFVGIIALIFAWFHTGKKKSLQEQQA